LSYAVKNCGAPGHYRVIVAESAKPDNPREKTISVSLIDEEGEVIVASQEIKNLKTTTKMRDFVRESAEKVVDRIKKGFDGDKVRPIKTAM
jgi:hypothetical protein